MHDAGHDIYYRTGHGARHGIPASALAAEKIPPEAVCNSILKPFDLEKFIEMIGECLRGPHAQGLPPSLP